MDTLVSAEWLEQHINDLKRCIIHSRKT